MIYDEFTGTIPQVTISGFKPVVEGVYMAEDMSAAAGKKLVSPNQAIAKAQEFLHQQSWAKDFDEKPSRVIESNECINILFRYAKPHQPPEGMVSVNKLDGALLWIKLG